MYARMDVKVPDDWAWEPSCFLQLQAGDAVLVLAVESDGWLFGRSQAGRSGWIPAHTLVQPAATGPFPGESLHDNSEVAVSMSRIETSKLAAPTVTEDVTTDPRHQLSALPAKELKRRLCEAGIAVPAGALEKTDLVALLWHQADNDPDCATERPLDLPEHQFSNPSASTPTPAAAAAAAAASKTAVATGQLAIMQRQIMGAPSGWDDATFMMATADDYVFVEHMEPDGWVWARKLGASGWAPASILTAEAAATSLVGCLVQSHRESSVAPQGWDPSNFLLIKTGEYLFVEHVEGDDWIWVRKVGRSGWVHASFLGPVSTTGQL